MSILIPTVLSTILTCPQDPQADPGGTQPVTIEFDDLHGEIVSIDGDHVRVEFPGMPDSHATLSRQAIPADRLFLWRRANMDADDAAAWLRLADFAGVHDLYMRRVDALREAAERAPDRAERIEQDIATTRAKCASHRLDEARRHRDDGDLDEAIELLEQVVADFADTDAGDEARALLDTIRADIDDERDRATRAQRRGREAAVEHPVLDDARDLLDEGRSLVQQGLKNLGDYVEAKRAFEDAVARFEAVRDRLERLAAEQRDDADTPAAVRAEREHLARRAERLAVKAHVELGYVYVARGDRQSAHRHVGLAAAMDPGNARIARLRQAIAASNDR